MECDTFHPMIEDPNGLVIPANPNVVTQVFGRNGVVRSINRNVTIARDLALLLVVKRKAILRKWTQMSLLSALKGRSNMLLRGAMNPRVRDCFLPMVQVGVLLCQTLKASSLQGILLNIVHTPLDLYFMPRCCRTSRQECEAVMFAELVDLGMQFGIVPVGLENHALGIVEDDRLRDSA